MYWHVTRATEGPGCGRLALPALTIANRTGDQLALVTHWAPGPRTRGLVVWIHMIPSGARDTADEEVDRGASRSAAPASVLVAALLLAHTAMVDKSVARLGCWGPHSSHWVINTPPPTPAPAIPCLPPNPISTHTYGIC